MDSPTDEMKKMHIHTNVGGEWQSEHIPACHHGGGSVQRIKNLHEGVVVGGEGENKLCVPAYQLPLIVEIYVIW